MRRGDITPDDLDRPDGNSLEDNYDVHDVGEAILIERIEEQLGYTVEHWGIDMREDDGSEGVIYDDKLDYRILDDGDLIGLVDLKTKTDAAWMGQFNRRHLKKYRAKHEEYDVPTFIVMFHVHDGAVVDEFVYDVRTAAYSSTEHEFVDQFPDGNNKALVPHENRLDWLAFVAQLSFEAEDYLVK